MSQEELIELFEENFGKILPDGKFNVYLNLSCYNHPLPNSITNINGWLDIGGYNHHLPNSIISVGNLYLGGYKHPLPNSITNTNYLELYGYNHPLPNYIKNVNGNILVNNGYTGLPNNIHEWDKVKKIIYYI